MRERERERAREKERQRETENRQSGWRRNGGYTETVTGIFKNFFFFLPAAILGSCCSFSSSHCNVQVAFWARTHTHTHIRTSHHSPAWTLASSRCHFSSVSTFVLLFIHSVLTLLLFHSPFLPFSPQLLFLPLSFPPQGCADIKYIFPPLRLPYVLVTSLVYMVDRSMSKLMWVFFMADLIKAKGVPCPHIRVLSACLMFLFWMTAQLTILTLGYLKGTGTMFTF